ncbi:hypothetical protein [Bacillus sp. NEB1478]|uniref:hypothetical protein n=1 Tax=Bacillus sp. NEB1478 TaxID=3073816 RepID=UPI002873E2DD|nr:hypothetical protein [Bacillus sp. NEB1478]WNB93734.1 hypothetical protein RGB74_08730 [Bacillus sp. NEB1478]
MKYIIERPIDSLGTSTVLSYLVDSQKISYVSQGPLRMNVIKMSMHGFKMIPGQITSLMSINTMKLDIVKQRISQKMKNGTTTLLASAEINFLYEADHQLKRARHMLISSPIDYCIGLSLSPEKLTPEILRYCKKQRVPFIELIVEDFKQLASVVWERIAEANFPYQSVIIPKFPDTLEEKKKKTWQTKWNELASRKMIPTFYKSLQEDEPIPLPFLKLLGIYPLKGGLFTGSDVDYCLVSNTGQDDLPQTVVVRGTIVYSQNLAENKQGYGKEISIIQPRRFGESSFSRV